MSESKRERETHRWVLERPRPCVSLPKRRRGVAQGAAKGLKGEGGSGSDGNGECAPQTPQTRGIESRQRKARHHDREKAKGKRELAVALAGGNTMERKDRDIDRP